MTKRIVVVEPYKKPYAMDMEDSLDSMQSIVGGWIEPTKPPLHDDDAIIICNEEGKIRRLTPNRKLHFEDGVLYDVICGTFFIINASPDEEDFTSLSEKQVEKYIAMYADGRTM